MDWWNKPLGTSEVLTCAKARELLRGARAYVFFLRTQIKKAETSHNIYTTQYHQDKMELAEQEKMIGHWEKWLHDNRCGNKK